MDDKLKELVEDSGWVNASLIIEVQGNDKDHIKMALTTMVERLEKEKQVKVYDKKLSKIETLDSGLFSHHIEVKLVARDFGKMVYLALMYSPSSVEIISPKNITIPAGEAQNILADVSSIVVSLAHSVFAKQGEINRLKGEAPSQKKA